MILPVKKAFTARKSDDKFGVDDFFENVNENVFAGSIINVKPYKTYQRYQEIQFKCTTNSNSELPKHKLSRILV